jgi:protein arginine kinase activator
MANVHFTQIINGKKVEMYLCEQCAGEKGKLGFSPQLNLGEFLWGFLPGLGGSGNPYLQEEQPAEVRCKGCGMSFEDFRKTGKLGCGECYDVFRENLTPILRRLHGSSEHLGKVPQRVSDRIRNSNEIEKLRTELTAAIGNEEYEKAAELRDRIRSLESAGSQRGGV